MLVIYIMKIIDCTTYFEEKMMMELRFNILDKYVDKFIVCEANFTHSGEKKEINFNIKDYPDFKNKIIHLILKDDPCKEVEDRVILNNRDKSILRIEKQRNYIKSALGDFSGEDYIIHSDNDEIPNLNLVNFKQNKKKILVFEQNLYYYKFNLLYSNFNWYGSKACKLKNLKSLDWLRMVKNKKYNFLRLDTLFSEKKYISLNVVKNGGWHFSNLKSLEGIMKKLHNDENYSEFLEKKLSKEQMLDFIERKIIPHNHFVDKKSNLKSQETKLAIIEKNSLPKYLQSNYEKYSKWFA